VWAGLFWGGRISHKNDHPIRYYTENYPNAPTAVEVGEDAGVDSIDVSTIGTQNIKLKIDSGSYNDVISSTFHTSGQTYSAYADVSSVLQATSLTKDKHVFTVANLTTMEGRENSPGAFGGWALVVIYAETHEYGKPRNISIYNGFIDIQDDDDPITISGFKLPTSGDVLAQLSVFSGEGEHLYGYRADHHDKHDWMKISSDGSSYSYMPGLTAGDHVGNRDNTFNAQLDNILRDHIDGEYNDLAINNVGVDIDNYDVSNLMTSYRDVDQNISEVKIKTSSDWDYITLSMIAFSAELYIPELCYDYTLDIDGHVIPSVNNEIQTPFGNFGKPLTTSLYLKSLEGDIDLTNVNVNYSIGNTNQVTYNVCPQSTTYISETGQYDYSPACEFTYNASNNGFGMFIGKNKTVTSGGTISAFEERYIKFESDLHTSNINTDFQFSVDYTVDYGSGAVPLHQIFTIDDLCVPTNQGFLPELGFFNITDSSNNYDEWNLYTQVSRRPFNLKLYAYAFDANDYLTPVSNDLNLSVEVEVIRADNFNRDANTACNDEHSIMANVLPKFLHFTPGANGKMVEFGYTANELDFAYRSAAMRIWYLTDVEGNGIVLDNHNCTRNTQAECVELYNDRYIPDTRCSVQCNLNNTSLGNCYECLRSNYGRKVCSRDNFAVRPESFITQIYDSNQSNDTQDPSNHIANSVVTATEFSLVSGYDYRFDINSTSHVNDVATPRYIQHFEPGSATHYIRMNWWPDGHTVSNCNDEGNKTISLNIFNGSNVNPITDITYVDKVNQIGKYRFEVYDQNWSSADWAASQMLHHIGQYADYYIDGTDCIKNSDTVSATGTVGKQGCVISSAHTNNNTGEEYKYLYAQYYPYEFDMSSLTYGARPGNDASNNAFVYINTPDLNLYPDGIDENMSYNVQGTFFAAGKDGGHLSNFVENCYADSVDMSLHQNYNHIVPTQTPELSYDLIDRNTIDNTTSRIRENGNFADTTDSATPLIIDQRQEHFVGDMNGSLNMDLGYNFVRTNDVELNPRSMYMRDFNITYTTPPADIFADLDEHHKIFGNVDIDQNVTFVYGRVKPAKTFYDDITAGNVNTPVSIVLYCDLGYTECQNRGILALLSQTNEFDWWKSVDHNQANGDGNIELSSVPASALNSTTVNINANGTNDTVNINNGGVVPLTVPVNLVVDDLLNPGPVPYTDRWLIFNPESAILPPIPFYRVRFIGSTGWAGYGDTGHVVGGTVSQNKNKSLEW
jgi:ribosomal protein L31